MQRKTTGVWLVAAALGCGPPTIDDGIGDEIDDSGSTSDEHSQSDTAEATGTDSPTSSESDTTESETTDSVSTDSETGIECNPVIEGDVLLDADTDQATFDSLACVEHITGDLALVHTTVDDIEFLSSLV